MNLKIVLLAAMAGADLIDAWHTHPPGGWPNALTAVTVAREVFEKK